ncbi:DinB family protein [Mucilaginibacter pocheonensis]|uniref:DinB-like domain-containing protein n=1 Tax=Mucilaginibacter pocheonensis TaxID=398050 RepID=A0ABU1TAC3_9SPHI|nr:DinB family protein [Mucilaginibacter pocheonensis]MDR6942342.1 hypothetical protein [Mucilaginibacter pocheonensis]
MTTDISTALNNVKQELQQTIWGFTQEQFNLVPFVGSWTAGQVAEHIIRFSSGGAPILNAPGTVSERDPAEKIEQLRDLFLNFNIKMIAPAFIEPSGGPHQKNTVISSLENCFSPMIELSKSQDLTLIYPDFDLPQFGTLTRLEWAYFMLFHTQRHIRQLNNIKENLK